MLNTSGLFCASDLIDGAADMPESKRTFRGGDFEKWKAGEEKWLERQKERADRKQYREDLVEKLVKKAGCEDADKWKDADDGDVNIMVISSFLAEKNESENKPDVETEFYVVRQEEVQKLLGDQLFADIFGSDKKNKT